MLCRTCLHFHLSKLPGYGYCNGAATFEQRAKFVPDESPCWLVPMRWIKQP